MERNSCIASDSVVTYSLHVARERLTTSRSKQTYCTKRVRKLCLMENIFAEKCHCAVQTASAMRAVVCVCQLMCRYALVCLQNVAEWAYTCTVPFPTTKTCSITVLHNAVQPFFSRLNALIVGCACSIFTTCFN